MENGSNESCVDVDAYFRSFGEYSTRSDVQKAFSLLFAFIFSAGVAGNAAVLASIWREPGLRTVRNLFILSLSVSDISVILLSGCFTVVVAIRKRWDFGELLCFVVPLVQGMSLIVSIATLTCIACDRYLLICHPAKPPLSPRIAVAMIVGTWHLGIALSLPSSFHTVYTPLDQYCLPGQDCFCGAFCDEQWPNQQLKKIYGSFVVCIQYFLPLGLIGFCYTRILRTVSEGILIREAAKTRRNNLSCLSDRQKLLLRRRNRTNRMLMLMVGQFALCWFPSVLVNILRSYSAAMLLG